MRVHGVHFVVLAPQSVGAERVVEDAIGGRDVVAGGGFGGWVLRGDLEVSNLCRETSRHVPVHSPARLHQLAGELHVCLALLVPEARPLAGVALGKTFGGGERDGAGQETDEVVHLGR